ncbi:MAG: restriction endonuclease subunit R, partial [Nitrososphaera sp.]
ARDTLKACQVTTLKFDSLVDYVDKNSYLVNQKSFQDSGWALIDKSADSVLSKIRRKGTHLGEQFAIHYGIKTGLNDAFVINIETREKLISEDQKSADLIKPLATGRDIKRYGTVDLDKFIIVIPFGWTRTKSDNVPDEWKWFAKSYPAIAKHLAPFEEDASQRYDKGEFWWELRACDYYSDFNVPKIIYPRISNKPSFTLDDKGCFLPDTGFFITSSSKYLLGVLNSKLMRFVSMYTCSTLIGGYYEFRSQYVEQFPIAPAPSDIRARIENLVTSMLKVEQKLSTIGSKLTDERARLEDEVRKIDAEIDELVYKLYGITEEEKKIIEECISEK